MQRPIDRAPVTIDHAKATAVALDHLPECFAAQIAQVVDEIGGEAVEVQVDILEEDRSSRGGSLRGEIDQSSDLVELFARSGDL